MLLSPSLSSHLRVDGPVMMPISDRRHVFVILAIIIALTVQGEWPSYAAHSRRLVCMFYRHYHRPYMPRADGPDMLPIRDKPLVSVIVISIVLTAQSGWPISVVSSRQAVCMFFRYYHRPLSPRLIAQ